MLLSGALCTHVIRKPENELNGGVPLPGACRHRDSTGTTCSAAKPLGLPAQVLHVDPLSIFFRREAGVKTPGQPETVLNRFHQRKK